MPSVPALAESPAITWSGFYAGVNAGARAGAATWNNPGAIIPEPYDYSSIGARAGLYAGYDWQFARRWIAGIEVDVGFADQQTRQANFFPGFAGTILPILPGEYSTVTLGWDASVRSRLGYLLTPSIMVFGTAGIAWQHVGLDVNCISICGAPTHGSGATVRPGWTIGSGIETAITGNWFARAEYRYADFGTFNLRLNLQGATAGVPLDVATHTMTAGLTYRFGVNQAAPAAAWPDQSPTAYNWAGAHIGVSGGMRFAEANWKTRSLGVLPIDATNFANYNGTGFHAGFLAGYDWQIAERWIVGIEGQFGIADKETTLPGFLPGVSGSLGGGPILPGDTASVKTTWDGALTARLGYLLRPSMLLFGSAGVALQRVEANSTCGALTCGIAESSTDAETMFGWTLGGGLETKLLRNWRVRTEYRYADFGTMRANFIYFGIPDPAVVDIRVRTHIAQFALIYDWN